jgi:hypothetical protein
VNTPRPAERFLAGHAGVATARGQPARAVRLAGAASAAAAGRPLQPTDQATPEGGLARARTALTAAALAAAWTAGQAMTLEQAVAAALEEAPAAKLAEA